jgi:hypothetical protein
MNCSFCDIKINEPYKKHFRFTIKTTDNPNKDIISCKSCAIKLKLDRYIIPESMLIVNHILNLKEKTYTIPNEIVETKKKKYNADAAILAVNNRVNAYYNVVSNTINSGYLRVNVKDISFIECYSPSVLISIYNSSVASVFIDTLDTSIFNLPIPYLNDKIWKVLDTYYHYKLKLIHITDKINGYSNKEIIDRINAITECLIINNVYSISIKQIDLLDECYDKLSIEQIPEIYNNYKRIFMN